MKRILYLLFAVSILWSCNSDYDDSALTGRVDDLENRVAKLEELCKQMNTNISSLQTLVNALQNKDCITSVVPITKDGEIIGYTISFTQSAPITIYNGQDGKDGQDGKPGEDGEDGQDGKPGEDGKDGITPQLKIEDGYWYISYNDGASWTQLGKATGDKGEQGEPGQAGGIFKDVEETDDSVIFTLNDDSTITIPKATPSEKLDITFGNTESINVLPGKTYEIEYTIIGADETTRIEVVAQDLYKASVSPTDYRSGKIIVTTPSADLEASRILVFVSKGTNTIMRIINFVESVIIVSTDTVEIAAEGETVQVEVETNVTYTVEIPEADRVWLSVAETRAATHTETLTFTAQANPNTTYRYSTVNLKDDSGLVAQSILFAQKASGYKTVHVETAGTLENYISADEKEKLIGLKLTGKLNTFDYDFMRTMPALESVDLAQIDNTTIPSSCFKNSKIKTVILPLNLEAIPDNAFYQSQITSIDIPSSVVSIGVSAFESCTSLAGDLILPNGLQSIGSKAFYFCEKLTGNLIIPNSVVNMGEYAFYRCSGFDGLLTLSSELTRIPACCFFATGFSGNLIIPDNVKYIGNEAFTSCYNFNGYLLIGSGVAGNGTNSGTITIGDLAFSKNSSPIFRKVYTKASLPPHISSTTFGTRDWNYINLYVPIGAKEIYQNLSYWEKCGSIEEVEF